MAEANQAYLGDGVYIELWEAGCGLKLYTSDGIQQSSAIYLEPTVIAALLLYINRIQANLRSNLQAQLAEKQSP